MPPPASPMPGRMLPRPPVFSVIVPVYNVEEYLAECLDSLLAQTCADWELLAVDDGSTDGSLCILRRYAAQEARLRIIQQENAGLSAARNTALAEARGEYCLFVDSDDVVHPQLLEICAYFLRKYNVEVVGFDHVSLEPHAGLPPQRFTPGELRHHVSRSPLHLLAQRHRYRLSMMAPLSCCRTALARRHPFVPGMLYEDYPRTTCLMRDVHAVVSLRAPLYGYTKRPGSIMRSGFNASHIFHYRRGLLRIAEAYRQETRQLSLVCRIVFPEILKQIGNMIFRAKVGNGERLEMLRALRALLVELRGRGLLCWRGHKWRRYLAYQRLLRAAETELESLLPRLSRVFR